MKLTAAIAMSYPNSKVTMNGYDDPIFKIDEIDFKHDEFTLMRVSNGDIFHEPIGKCQLLLTQLCKISDEDAVEVGKAFGLKKMDGHYYEWIGKAIITHHFTMYSPWDDSIFDTASNRGLVTNIHSRNYLKLVDYLRSKGYDCGHGSIPNLIAAGVAVAKEIV